MFWKKKKVEPPLQFPEPRELTGIEKAEKEEAAKRIADWKRESDEKRDKIMARISELRKQIKPQTDEIRTLEMKLEPAHFFNYSQYYAGHYNCAQTPYTVSSGLSSLLGLGGVRV